MKIRGGSTPRISLKWFPFLCASCFALGILFYNRLWVQPESNDQLMSLRRHEQELQVVSEVSAPKKKNSVDNDVMDEVLKTHEAIQ